MIKKILNKGIFPNAIAIAGVSVTLFVILAIGIKIYTRHSQTVTIPNLKGVQIDAVEALLEDTDLKYLVVDSVYEKRGTPGSVLEQVPKAGVAVKAGRTVYLTVQAKGQPMVSVPNLVDYPQRQAVSLLEAMGFKNIQTEEAVSEYKGLVLSVEFNHRKPTPGQKVPLNAFVKLKVGSGYDTSAEMESDSLNYSSDSIAPADEIHGDEFETF